MRKNILYEGHTWDYSSLSDILSIQRKGVTIRDNAELGQFTIGFDSKDNIVGASIEHASEFFKNMNIKTHELKEIKHAVIKVNSKDPNILLVWVYIKLPNREIPPFPIPAPIMRH